MTTPSTLTSKTVGKGKSSRMAKGREAAAKAQANADAVADLNARQRGELTRTAAIQYLQAHGIYSGHSRDSVEQLRQLVAEHKAGPKAPAITDPLTAAEKAQLAQLDAEAAGPELLPDGPERVAAAKAEHKLLQAWIKDGEQPPRPATPNLDAMNADYAAGRTAADRRREAKTTRATGSGTRTHRNPRYAEATAAKKAGARGKGKAVTDAELDAYVAGVLAADPEAQRNEELEVAYWLEKLALSRPRWVAAWDRCTAPQVATSAA